MTTIKLTHPFTIGDRRYKAGAIITVITDNAAQEIIKRDWGVIIEEAPKRKPKRSKQS